MCPNFRLERKAQYGPKQWFTTCRDFVLALVIFLLHPAVRVKNQKYPYVYSLYGLSIRKVITDCQPSKSQNPIKTPKHFIMDLIQTTPTPSPSLASTVTRISVASRDSDVAMPSSGTRGRVMAMKDTREESAMGSNLALEASRAEMVAAKYAGGMRGRRSVARLEQRGTTVVRWWCCDVAELV